MQVRPEVLRPLRGESIPGRAAVGRAIEARLLRTGVAGADVDSPAVLRIDREILGPEKHVRVVDARPVRAAVCRAIEADTGRLESTGAPHRGDHGEELEP